MAIENIPEGTWEDGLFELEVGKRCSDVADERLARLLRYLSLENEVVPLELRRILQGHDLGLEYVYRVYGTLPNQLYVKADPEKGRLGMYWYEDDTIYLFDNLIRLLSSMAILSDIVLFNELWRYGKGGHFSAFDMSILSGVEEAYHSYQYKKKPEVWYKPRPSLPSRNASDLEWEKYYRDDPIEADATKALLKAMKDLKMGPYRPVSNINRDNELKAIFG